MTNSKPPRRRRIAADEAHAWARNLRLGNPFAKLVLSMLALYVNGEGSCYVGAAQLAEDCELALETIRRRLGFLEQIGAIARFPQWLDEHGRRNGEGRGKRTSDDIRLLFDTDPEEIEARSRGEATDESASPPPHRGQADDPAPPPHTGQNSGGSLPGVYQPPHCGGGPDSSELEPEDSPPNPPPGGGQDDLRKELEASFVPFTAVYPAPITDMPKALDIWRALNDGERADASLGAKGYAKYLAEVERKGRSRNVKDAHRWLKDRMWVGYLKDGQAAEIAAARVDIREGSEAWHAWDIFYRCCGWSEGIPSRAITGAFGSRLANVPREHPPVGHGLNPDRNVWMTVTEGGGPFAAWMRRLRELPDVRIVERRDPATGKQSLRVPQEWPPAKHIQPVATAPPVVPQSERQLAHERR